MVVRIAYLLWFTAYFVLPTSYCVLCNHASRFTFHAIVTGYPPKLGDEHFGGVVLADEGCGSCGEGLLSRGVIIVDAEDDHPRFRCYLTERHRGGDAIHPGHLDVREQNIGA